jgi:hypothetical protein
MVPFSDVRESTRLSALARLGKDIVLRRATLPRVI